MGDVVLGQPERVLAVTAIDAPDHGDPEMRLLSAPVAGSKQTIALSPPTFTWHMSPVRLLRARSPLHEPPHVAG